MHPHLQQPGPTGNGGGGQQQQQEFEEPTKAERAARSRKERPCDSCEYGRGTCYFIQHVAEVERGEAGERRMAGRRKECASSTPG